MKRTFKVTGMHCNSCENLIENELKEKKGVENISASFSEEKVEIEFDEDEISEKEIKDKIIKLGYNIGEEKETKKETSSDKTGLYVLIGSLVLLAFVIYWFFLKGINVEIPAVGETGSIILLFFIGILTGFHCISMCGGFVVGYTTRNAEQGHKGFKQHFVYGGAKVASYAIIGGIFGLIGGAVAFSIGLRAGVAIFAGLFMISFALSMLGVKFFRRLQFNPKFLSKWASKKTHGARGFYKAPFMTGILSGLFIACGPLQALYLFAAGTGSFWMGFLSLGAFSLGTLPVLIGFGSLTSVISKNATKRILKIAAILVLILGLIMLNRGLTVLGSPVTYDVIKEKIVGAEASGNAIIKGDYQEIHMEVNRYGWEPNSFVLKKGVPVKWLIDVKELTGCNNEIIVRDYNLQFKLKKGLNTVEFTPDKVGTIRWSCWMGMIPGSFIVTEDGTASQQEVTSAVPQSSGSCGGSCGAPSCGAASGGLVGVGDK
jgi:uncharacterized protein